MKLRFAQVAVVLLLAAACGDDPVGGGGSDALTISADTTYVATAGTLQLSAKAGGAATVAWRSLNETVASVNGSGLVTGRRVGAADIVAESGVQSDTIRINVTPRPGGALAVGASHACVLDVEGKAYCWGANTAGQLGNGTTTASATPVPVQDGHVFDLIAAGDSTTCGVTLSGEAYCWGLGRSGQLGNGTLSSSAVPVRVATFDALKSIAVGLRVTCALGLDGTAYCWGSNANGNVGNGNRVVASTPTLVSTSLKFSQVSVGFYQSCGLATDGAAYCWGRNAFQTLGTGGSSATEALTPAPVAGGLRYSWISAGTLTTCAIATTGGTYCWGVNGHGSLGVGHQGMTGGEGATPTRVVGDEVFTRVEAGHENNVLTPNCLLTATGQAYCLGASNAGQLGTTATTETCQLNSTSPLFPCASRPLAVTGGLAFEAVAPGAEFACGLTRDGRAFCWGSNGAGQLGAFAGTQTATPTRVAATLRLP
ncbi:MAG TPA: Ig-like domain-containing protein [Longimicrobium sp.]|jgi:alpha-tubulin suppressor-like RCC1 family protein